MQVYNLRLDERVARKAFIQAHDLLNLRRYQVTRLLRQCHVQRAGCISDRSYTHLQVAGNWAPELLPEGCMTLLGSMSLLGHLCKM